MTAAAITIKIPYLCDKTSYTLFCITFLKFFSIIKLVISRVTVSWELPSLFCRALWDTWNLPREFQFVDDQPTCDSYFNTVIIQVCIWFIKSHRTQYEISRNLAVVVKFVEWCACSVLVDKMTLREEIAKLTTPTPVFCDPEDDIDDGKVWTIIFTLAKICHMW